MRAFFLVLLLGLAGCAYNVYESAHSTAHRLTLYFADQSGVCSSTAVGPHALLTAEHCIKNIQSVAVDGKLVAIHKILLDGNDHAVLLVEDDFAFWAHIGPGPKPG